LYIAFSVTPSAVAGSTPGAEAISGWVGPVSNTKPVVTNVTISGLTKVGSVLTASYQYSDDEGDLEGASEYQWMRSDNSDGSSLLI
jgi:hypothetical protein